MSNKDLAVQNLQKTYNKNGFITSNNIYDVCNELNLSIFDTDYVMNRILYLGILMTDTADKNDSFEINEETVDYAQVDYNKIYNYFLSNYPNMKYIIDTIKSVLPIQHGEVNKLITQIRSGNNQAKEILFRKNMRAALKAAYNYRKRTTISLEDIFQEACISILKAIDLYNPYEHSNFTTYCSRWVMQRIDRYIADHESFIRIPVHAQNQINFIENIVSENFYENESQLIKLITAKTDLTYKQAQNILMVFRLKGNNYIYDSFESLDEINIVSDDDIEEQITDIIKTKEIYAALNQLPKRERDVLCMRYGLLSGHEYTLEEIGDKMNVTRERIRQIEAKALRRLRNPSVSKKLYEFY
jgi:RNA polymerase primary sigma factor